MRVSLRRRLTGGFTLIEVMVAVGLLSSMSAFVLGSYFLLTKAQDATETRMERFHGAWVTLNRMKRELAMAFISKHVNQEEPRSKTLFDGGKTKLTFNSLSHQRIVKGVTESDQSVIEYYLKSTGRGGKGLYRRQKLLVDDDPEDGGRVDLLLEGVRKLEFEYWDREDEDWESTWEVTSDDFEAGPGGQQIDELVTDEDKTLQLPWRVRIRIELEGPNGRDIEFVTQTAIYMREPLDFTQGGVLSQIGAARAGAAGRGGAAGGGARGGGAAPAAGAGGRR